jgi:hypothetical protein
VVETTLKSESKFPERNRRAERIQWLAYFTPEKAARSSFSCSVMLASLSLACSMMYSAVSLASQRSFGVHHYILECVAMGSRLLACAFDLLPKI